MRRAIACPWRRKFRPGSDATVTISFSTDVAANIFAVLFVVLVIAAAGTTAGPASTADIEVVASWRERRPLDADRLIDLLHRRQAGGPGLLLDLTQEGLRLLGPGERLFLPWSDAGGITRELSRRLDAGVRPNALYVFDPRGYALVSRAIGPGPTEEMSPPAALRRCRPPNETRFGCLDGDDWSAAFLGLQDHRLNTVDFRSELARLLAAQPTQAPSGQINGASAAQIGTKQDPPPIEMPSSHEVARLADQLSGWIFVALMLVWVELATWRQRRRSLSET